MKIPEGVSITFRGRMLKAGDDVPKELESKFEKIKSDYSAGKKKTDDFRKDQEKKAATKKGIVKKKAEETKAEKEAKEKAEKEAAEKKAAELLKNK